MAATRLAGAERTMPEGCSTPSSTPWGVRWTHGAACARPCRAIRNTWGGRTAVAILETVRDTAPTPQPLRRALGVESRRGTEDEIAKGDRAAQVERIEA